MKAELEYTVTKYDPQDATTKTELRTITREGDDLSIECDNYTASLKDGENKIAACRIEDLVRIEIFK